MTAKENRLFAAGVGAGLVVAALVAGLTAVRAMHGVTAASSASASADTTRATVDLSRDQGTQPGTAIQMTPVEMTAAGVQVAEVQTAALKSGIDAFGRVEQPESQLAAVSAWVGGRVDKLYVQYTGERVRRGQPVAELYSPEVATAIEEYRLAEENRNQLRQSDDASAKAQADALVNASRRKLELWGIAEKQFNAPAAGGVPHVTIYANNAGTVVERKVTQGQYVNAGETLLTVADLSEVWIKADVYEEQLPQIAQGQQVSITAEALPGQTLHGHVEFIEPTANSQTRTVPVHVHLANPGMRLLPGMFVSASFISRSTRPGIVIPRSAVIDTGTRKIVYVAKPDGVFEAREVQVGAPAEDLFPVASGLALGDKVVLNGNFLIDSQAHLSSGMSGLYGGSKEFAGTAATTATTNSGAEAPAATIDFHAEPDPLKAGEDNQFNVSLTDAQGKPVSDAIVNVKLIMPAMPAMNMPEMKSSFDLLWAAESKKYIGKGQAPVAGTWTVFVEARKNGPVIATFHTHLSAR
ncbi:MAG: efflux RND transporter periplasmic adaptor subunit [Terracidiphilus sp.]|jgi:Cu(I)/Ag(I) efflux system membrane fusion protein